MHWCGTSAQDMDMDIVYFVGNGASGKIYKILEYGDNIYHVNFLLWKCA